MTTRGAANRRKGHDAERALVTWLRANGWPHAERSVRTGFRSGDRELPDTGDVDGTPGIVWQVKNVAREDIAAWLTETEAQRTAARAHFGVLVQRRSGKADPGRWWAWMRLGDFSWPVYSQVFAPMRLEVRHLASLLRDMGYGGEPS